MVDCLLDESSWPKDAIEVARVIDAWGIKGAIKVKPFAKDPQALFSSRRWLLKPSQPQGAHQVGPNRAVLPPGSLSAEAYPVLRVSSTQTHGDVIVVHSLDVPDRNAAESLRGARIFVSRSAFPTPSTNEYYWVDLMGLEVVNREGGMLGVVEGLIETGPHSVLSVVSHAPTKQKRLIPFVEAYIDDVNLAARQIVVDWGLDY